MPKHTWTVSAAEAGQTLDKFLAAADRLGSRSKATAARERGKVFVNGSEADPGDVRRRLDARDEVQVWEDRPGSSRRRPVPFKSGPLNILYEDQHLIVLNKPAGLLAVPLERKSEEMSIFDQIEDHFRSHGKRKPFVVHRIDRDTSGIVLFAKDARTHAALKHQFRERTPERIYLAVVYGHPTPRLGHMARSSGLGRKGTHPEGNAPEGSARRRSDQPLHGRRGICIDEPGRGSPAYRQAQPNPHPGAPSRPHAGRRSSLHLWT